MLLWISILLLLDAGLALWNEHRIKHVLPSWNIKRIAILEGVIAVFLIFFHIWRTK